MPSHCQLECDQRGGHYGGDIAIPKRQYDGGYGLQWQCDGEYSERGTDVLSVQQRRRAAQYHGQCQLCIGYDVERQRVCGCCIPTQYHRCFLRQGKQHNSTITITGSNFTSNGLAVDLLDPVGQSFACCGSGTRPPQFVSPTQIVIQPNFSNASGNWRVRVRTSAGESAYYSFYVSP